MEIFKLFGTILVDSAKAEESISKTEQKAEGLGGKLGKGIETAGKWALGIGAAVGAVGGVMIGLAANTADAAGDIDDMAQRTGTTAEEFQKYAYAAKLSGMETATLEKAMIKSQTAFTDAKSGSKAMSEAYQALGIDINNIGSSSEAFDEVVMRLADMEDETQRNKLANDIFGKSYAELAPLLNGGSEGIKALKDEAVALGGVMSNEAVAAGADFGDMLDKSKTMIGGVFNSIGIQLLPILMELLTWVMNHMPEIQKVIEVAFKAVEFVVGIVGKAFDTILPILTALYDWIEPYFPVIQQTIETTFDAIGSAVETVTDIFWGIVDAVKAAIDWLDSWNKKDVDDKDFGDSGNNNRPYRPNKTDGSHASGLAYVPYDGYVAEVHKGEEIVNAQDKQSIMDLVRTINLNTNNTQSKVELTVKLDSKILARQIYDPLQNEAKVRGKLLTAGT